MVSRELWEPRGGLPNSAGNIHSFTQQMLTAFLLHTEFCAESWGRVDGQVSAGPLCGAW